MKLELHMEYETAERLGAFPPRDPVHHRRLLDEGKHILIRAKFSGLPLFWPLVTGLGSSMVKPD